MIDIITQEQMRSLFRSTFEVFAGMPGKKLHANLEAQHEAGRVIAIGITIFNEGRDNRTFMAYDFASLGENIKTIDKALEALKTDDFSVVKKTAEKLKGV